MRRDSDTMTSCRIERKRAHDREAQRASRAKTKAYIAHLEKTVADLSESSGDNGANYLAQHATHQSQEIDKLQGLLGKIKTLVHDATKDGQSPPPANGRPALKIEANPDSGLDAFQEPLSATQWDDSPPSDDQWVQDLPKPREPKKKQPLPSSTRNLNVFGISLLCEKTKDDAYFQRVNSAMIKVEATPDNLSGLEEDMDILIRAIVQGWDASERVHHFDIAWRFIRAFDEGLWYRAAPMERLIQTWALRANMVYRIQPKNQERRTPAAFMVSTEHFADAELPIVNYFGWPQVREQLLNGGANKCSGEACIAFAESFRFVWPWALRDAYKINRSTGLYSLTEGFLKNFNDLSNYRMLSNAAIPFHPPPVLSQTSSAPDLADLDDDEDSSPSVDEDVVPPPPNAAQDKPLHTENWLATDIGAEEWMQPFLSEVQDLHGGFGVDAFGIAHDLHLAAQCWPTT